MQQQNDDQLKFEKLYKKTKYKIFQALKIYLDKTQNINPLIIYFLILIQSLQILWFSIHPLLYFQKQSTLLTYIRSILSYLNFQQTIRNNNQMLYPCIIIITIINVIHVVTIGISVKYFQTYCEIKSDISYLVHNLTMVQIVLVNTVFTIPIFNVSAITLYCQQGSPYHQTSTCYDTIYVVMCILATLNLLILLLQSILYWFIFYLRNPFSKSYYSLSTNLNKLGKLLIKILPPLYFIIDIHYMFQNVYVFMFLFLIILYIGFFRIFSIHNFNQHFFYFQLFLQSVIGWFAINSVICYQFPDSKINFIQTVICSLLCAYSICTIQSSLTKKFFISNIQGPIKKQDRQKFLFLLINLLFYNYQNFQINPIVYIKLINSNSNVCNIKISKLLMKSQLKNDQLQYLSRQTLLLLLTNFMEQSSTTNLKFMKFIILYDSGQRILALHQVTQLHNQKLSVYDQFMIYYFKSTKKIYQSAKGKGVQQSLSQIQNYLHYIEHMNQFQNQLEICALNNQHYWEQLCQDMPSINKVYSLAQRSLQYIKKIQTIYKKIQAIYQQNISSLLLYYHFLSDVCVRYRQCQKIKQKLIIQRDRQRQKQLSQRQLNQGSRIKYKPNQKMCVLHVSTASISIGIILNCNSQVRKYLGYDKSQLFNQKVTKIMPKIFSQIHDTFIVQYLKKADSVNLPAQKRVFALHKNLRIIQTCLAVKIFPNVVNGFQLVGFFKQKNKKQDLPYLILNLKTYQVQGISIGFIQLSGNRIKLPQIQKQPLKLSHLFPQLDSNHKFTQNQSIQTLFRFSDCTDKLIQIQQTVMDGQKKFQKIVTITVDSISHYGTTQIAYLLIKQLDTLISLKDTTGKQKSHKSIKPKPDKHKTKPDIKSKKLPTIQQHQDIIMQRRVQDFINQKSYYNSITFVQIIFILSIFAFIISMISMNIYKAMNIMNLQLIQQMNLAANISIIEGKILILNQNILLSLDNSSDWQTCRSTFASHLQSIQQTAVTLFAKADQRLPSNLIINQRTQYPFISRHYSTNKNTTTNLYYIDGLIQAIVSGKSMLNYSIDVFIDKFYTKIYQNWYFIFDNMHILLPEISENTIQAYSDLFSTYHNGLFISQVYFVVIKSLLLILLYIILYFLIKKFVQFTKLVSSIYSHILKWDAYELYMKCYKFRTKILQCSSKQNEHKRNNSNLLKVFPKSLLVMLTQGLDKNITQDKTKNKLQLLQRRSILRNSDQIDNLIQNQGEFVQNNKTPDKGDLIQMNVQTKFQTQYYVIFIFLILVLGGSFFFLLLFHGVLLQLQTQNSTVQSINSFTKLFLFTYYYGLKSLQSSTYLPLYNFSLTKFFSITKSISGLMSSQQYQIRQVYKSIQILNSIITDQTSINSTASQNYISSISYLLLNSSDIIQNYVNSFSKQWETDIQTHITTLKIIKSIVQIVLICLFCQLVLVFVIKPIKNRINHSINMIKMMPIWIIIKNNKIKQVIKLSITNPNPNTNPTTTSLPQLPPQPAIFNIRTTQNLPTQQSSTNLMLKSTLQKQDPPHI